MKNLIGLGSPSDFCNFALRAGLARRYGLFGRIPMWGGIRLHAFYPALSTLLVRFFTMQGALLLYLTFTAMVWAFCRGWLIAVLFLISFYHFQPLFKVGRFAEFLGYAFITLAFFTKNSIACGILLGLAGLTYPLPFMLGCVMLAFRPDLILFLIAFLVCGWWYIPFLWQRKKISFLQEKRNDKFLGLYITQYLSLINLVVFIFSPPWLCFIFGILLWFLPVSIKMTPLRAAEFINVKKVLERMKEVLFLKPFFVTQLKEKMPGLDKISEDVVVITQPNLSPGIILEGENQFAGSLKHWVWASAVYLLERNIIVYNGLPSTEVPAQNLEIPKDLKIYSIFDLGFKAQDIRKD
jgi:hypothetical protein